MTRRYLTHFSTIFIAHVALIFGGLTIIEHEVIQKNLGGSILNLKVASDVLFSAPKVVVPVTSRKTPVTAKAPVQEAKPGAIPEVQTSTLSGTAIADLKSMYRAEVRAQIDQNKFYPVAARRLGQTGTVIVAFTLLADGSIINVRIDNSSGSARLDSAGLEAVKKVGKFKPIPSEFGEASLDMLVPLKFQTL